MRALRDAVRPFDELFELVADGQLVLLGEATHGTHEFYEIRAALTRRLIAERGFRGVAVEADWPRRRASTASCSGPAATVTPRRRSAALCASRAGCGATT
jgi:erythromycin esterase-like protein